MTTFTLWMIIILAVGFGIMFITTFLQMMNINKMVKDTNDILDCLWATLGFLDEESVKEAERKVIKRVKKSKDSAASRL